jgi:hypothetical protein
MMSPRPPECLNVLVINPEISLRSFLSKGRVMVLSTLTRASYNRWRARRAARA